MVPHQNLSSRQIYIYICISGRGWVMSARVALAYGRTPEDGGGDPESGHPSAAGRVRMSLPT